MLLLPQYMLFGVIFVLGLIMGSFLDVLASRFNTGKSINDRSRCFSCGRALSWYELVPVFSYVFLRGRCQSCQSRIPGRLIAMELVTGLLFLFVALMTENVFFLPLHLVLLCVLIVVVHYDMRHMVIPHRFVFIIGALAGLDFGLTTYFVGFDPKVALLQFTAAVLSFSFYGFLWLVSKGRWIGLGDAKLAFALGLFLSPLGAFSMIVFSFWVGAAVSVLLLGLQKLLKGGKIRLAFLNIPLTMKSEVPFAPFMVVAFLLVFFSQVNVLTFLSSLF